MHQQYSDEFLSRFWSRVDKSGECWLWTGSKTPAGYGQISLNGGSAYAHAIAIELAGGDLSGGLRSLHVCDTPNCVRNDEIGIYVVDGVTLPRYGHLFAGTQADNLADMRAKARHSHGEAHRAIMREKAARGDRNGSRTHPERLIGRTWTSGPMRPEQVRRGEASGHVTLTEVIVREMRRAWDAGEATQTQLAARYGVTQTNVSLIVRRKSWQHVD
jgi:hypothetical protein